MNGDPRADDLNEQAGSAFAELGGYLAALRRKAGYSQRELARRLPYNHSTVAGAETARWVPSRMFWERCEDALSLDLGALTRPYDQAAALRARARLARTGKIEIPARPRAADANQPAAVIIVWSDGTTTTATPDPPTRQDSSTAVPAGRPRLDGGGPDNSGR
jgi:transcriptional regulator with XRE-family HTH domain